MNGGVPIGLVLYYGKHPADSSAPTHIGGRYQLLSAQCKWLATGADRKLVVDDQNQLFRTDAATGETVVLAFGPDQNSRVHSFWAPVGK